MTCELVADSDGRSSWFFPGEEYRRRKACSVADDRTPPCTLLCQCNYYQNVKNFVRVSSYSLCKVLLTPKADHSCLRLAGVVGPLYPPCEIVSGRG